MEITNGFSKGMIKDLGELLRDPQSYDDALDIRLNSNNSASDHIVVNIKGNELSVTVPDVPNIVTLEYTAGSITDPWSITPIILTDGSSSPYIGTPISGTGTDVTAMFDQIENSLRTDTAFSTLDLNIARSGNRIRIWSYTESLLFFSPLSPYTTITVQNVQASNLIIGWVNIEDDIFLFTTNDSSATGSIGSIFRVQFDNITLTPTTTLIYSENVNFTTEFPIANPGGIEGVRENSDITRIYWTDRLNDLRVINVADPNVMAVTPDQLSFRIGTQLKKPTLYSINENGSLVTGHYQVAYALNTEGGAQTGYSHTSNSIYIVEDSFVGNSSADYRGNDSTVITNKSFTVKITDVDTSFSTMSIIILRKESADSTAFIEKVAEIPINNDTVYYTHSGSETSSIITENEFNRRNNMFDKCHTIAQKDNILFAANTERDPFTVTFDARAYRWPSGGGNLILNDLSGNSTTYSTANALSQTFILPENLDAINPDQTINKYQSDGITLGGEGPNISYTFTQQSTLTDARASNDYSFPWRIPWIQGGGEIDLGDGVAYQEGNAYTDMASPFRQHSFKGYRRGETYRFSWVPFKDGKEGYAQWIADIRMPDIFEEYVSGDPWSANGVFNLMDPDFTLGTWSTQQLGIQFNINIPQSVADQIDGYRIKRVKLEPEDRTVIAQGMIHLSRKSNTFPEIYTPVADNGGSTTVTYYGCNGDGFDIWNGNESYRIVSFHSPDLLFGRPLNFRSGDRLRVVSGVSERVTHLGFTAAQRNRWYKLYDEYPLPFINDYNNNTVFSVEGAQNVQLNGSATIDGLQYDNSTQPNSGSVFSFGTDTVVLALDRGFPKTDVPAATLGTSYGFTASRTSFVGNTHTGGSNGDHPDKIICNYERDNIGQYGGKGYTARTQNVYINTGCEVHLNGTLSHTLRVFGGDTYVNVFDSLKMVRNLSISPNDTTRATAFYFPCETFVNTELREGFSCNTDYGPNDIFAGTGVPDPADHPLDYGEDFKYNYLFSEQMDTQRSFPLPLNTNDVTEHPVRIWASGIKTYGELSDSWRIFDSQKYIDIQGNLGEIRQLMNVNEQLVAWQKRGFGIASVNERSVINDASGNGIILGQSGILPRFDYISEKIGSWHQFGFAKGPNSVLFFDMKDGGIYSFSKQGLRDITEGKLKGWLYENTRNDILNYDSSITGSLFNAGICATYDQRNKEFLITFHDTFITGTFRSPNTFTIAYDERYDRFTSYRSFKPKMYINDGEYVFSTDPNDLNKMYIHDRGDRGVFYDNDPSTSYITLIPNQHPNYSKVYDNIRWYSEVYDNTGNEISTETVSGITVFNPYQTTGVQTNIKRLLREWKFTVLYEQNTKNRIRGHYCREKFDFLNNNDKEFKLYYVTNNYRIFPK